MQAVARQAETFARTVGRSAEATAAPLGWVEGQLRRDIPEAVAACQAALDEHLPQALSAVAVGDLGERAAALLDSLQQAAVANQAQLQAIAQQELQRMDAEHAAAVEAQQQRTDAAKADIAAGEA